MSAPSPQLVFEGPDPERLLLEAWSVHGTQVRITEPVTVRRGGIGGFFQKEHYRIEVVPTPAEAGETSFHDTSEVPCAVPSPTDEPKARAAAAPSAPQRGEAVQPSTYQRPATTAAALDALVEATEDRVDLASSRRASFDEVLDKVASSLGDDPDALAASLPAEPSSTEEALATPAVPPAARPAEPAERVASADLARPVVPARPFVPEAEDPLPAAASLPAPGLLEELDRAGFPRALLQAAPVPPRNLVEAFALAPAARPLPRTPGSLVAVVGSVQVARILAAQLGIPRAEVARARRWRTRGEAAAPAVVHDAREAADLAPGWRRDRVGVVAVSIASYAEDGAWARAMLRALGPSMTIAIASATTKAEDIEAACAAIGGVDALALEDLDATLTPAEVLATGVPVGMLDGMPADAATWVAAASRALARRSGEA